ncbi:MULTISPECIES: hypothetical protein [unclassified Bradyrhizobium]|uniref:hypothetical protein n=1 Tax=unclassified Bradyrhizobium TaxID=2631580 RepID=UPI001FFA7228|nr:MULTISPECIES: hypothetical protein [unclassified Bradyrhizobium]MCK1412469.1 hypothetical protein [Bradyrhizobium sp. CW4]UPJ26555.1 hypothetical protein IVB54_33595 [Bradyrhizobium sp. CW1]
MIVGYNHHRLEKRIEAALLKGMPDSREASFLQQMSRHILLRGGDASLSNRQAAWLFAILARNETKNAPITKPAPAPRLPKRVPAANRRETIDIEDCLVRLQSTPQQSQSQANVVVQPITTQSAPAAEPKRAHQPDMARILKQALQKNENFRKRRERLERQYLKL